MAAAPEPGPSFAAGGRSGRNERFGDDTSDDSEDNISITSTQYEPENSDMEYEVEDILAQDDNMDGATKYLVKWTNYPLEKCTWEPEEHMGHELLEDVWEKKRGQPGYKPFDVSLYNEALLQRDERHFRRNRKRKRLGFTETAPFEEDTEEQENDSQPDAETDVLHAEVPNSDDDSDSLFVSQISTDKSNTSKRHGMSNMAVATPVSAPTTGEARSLSSSEPKNPSDKIASHQRGISAGMSTAAHGPLAAQKEKRLEKGGLMDAGKASKVAPKRSHKEPPMSHLQEHTKQTTKPSPKPPERPPAFATDRRDIGPSHKHGLHKTGSSYSAPTGSTTFSATKTSSTQAKSSGNAFISGKKIRARPVLANAMTDPARQQHLFGNRHLLRVAELQERSKADRAIDPSKLNAPLFPIAKGPRPTASASDATGRQDGRLPAAASAKDAAQATASSAVMQSGTLKRKKSVRFLEPEDDEKDGGRVRFKSPPVMAQESEDDVRVATTQFQPEPPGVPLQPLGRKLLIGTQREPVDVVLSIMAQPGNHPAILEEVFADAVLRFQHSCFSETLIQQLVGFREKNLFSGTVSETTEAGRRALEAVSGRLRAMATGLVLLRRTYAVLVYPTQSDDWQEALFGFPTHNDADGTNALLRYVVFSTVVDGSGLLRPVSNADTMDVDDDKAISDRERVMRQFLHLERQSYFNLFSKHRQPEQKFKRNVFLAFPPSMFAFMQQVAHWMRAVDPDCVIFYSSYRGAWFSFLEKVAADRESGAVVVHELAAAAIRRFPGVGRLLLLENRHCTFSMLSQSILSPPTFHTSWNTLSLGEYDGHGDAAAGTGSLATLGRAIWTPLFPGGLALLVTPSFLVSEPKAAYILFHWFYRAIKSQRSHITLITTWDICWYLRELADEKLKYYDRIMGGGDMHTPDERKQEAARLGVSVSHCRYRLETWLLAGKICDHLGIADVESVGGGNGPLVFADRRIDGNDEQSLVNWFGWWSSINADQHRLFYVVGSTEGIRKMPKGLAGRKVRMPAFSPESVADPDVARERMHDVLAAIPAREVVEAAHDGGGSAAGTPSTVSSVSAPPQRLVPAVAARTTVRSRRFPDDSPTAFTLQLMRYGGGRDFWKCYGYVVYWRDADEAFKHGMLNSVSFTITSWFQYTWPFSVHNKDYRTYIALFYLIDSDAQGRAAPGSKPPRHPWVVVYRPIQPHVRPFKSTELIFWDVRAKSRFRGRDTVWERQDLTPEQRDVVDYVRKNGKTKNPGMPLKRIWIGGEQFKLDGGWGDGRAAGRGEPLPGAVNELDATMEYLDTLTAEVRDVLPATGSYMEARGFKIVMGENDRGVRGEKGKDKSEDRNEDTKEDIREDKTDEKKDEKRLAVAGDSGAADASSSDDMRIVFHAPRGTKPRHVGSSKCRNRFFESAWQERMKNPRATLIVVEFRPTKEWYADQVDEDRAWEQMQVVGWPAFFEKFKVEDALQQEPEQESD